MKLLSTENQIVHLYPVLVSYWAPVVGVAAEFNLIIVSFLATLHEMTFNKTDGCHLISPREREHIIKLTYFPHLCSPSLPHQRKVGKRKKGEEQTAGSDQNGGIGRRGGHGEREEDLSAANV